MTEVWHELLNLGFVKDLYGYVKKGRADIMTLPLKFHYHNLTAMCCGFISWYHYNLHSVMQDSSDLRLNNLKPEPLFQSYSH